MAGFETACFGSSNIVIASVVVLLLAGLPGLLLSPARFGQACTAVLVTLAALAGIPSSVVTLLTRATTTWELFWTLPYGPAQLVLDPLAALFLLPVFLVSACGSLYGLRYRPASGGYDRTMSAMYALLAGSMALIVLAGDSLLFLIAWELMALSCYLLLIADHHQREVRDAGTLYLIATHTGTLVLIALFALLYQLTGSFVLPATGSLAAAGPLSGVVFVLALLGLGAKAGLMPLHVWLPSAHANAPSHASAIMSGVILKMGIYGIVRTVTLFDGPPLWWGLTLLALGTISAVAGVAFALGQHDLKRLLAYHSIENIGIICMGLGVGLCGLALGRPAIALLGLAGGLLHMLNHAVFKALLFLGAGAVIHTTASRELDRMGGLLRVMPRTGLFFLVGAVAICGLPPLNGFVSELLVYLGLFRQVMAESGSAAVLAALAIPALALVGGLAVACFVKVFGVVFLGTARQPLPATAHEPGWPMLVPMGLLALLCLLIGLVPVALAPMLEAAVSWHPLLRQEPFSLAVAAPLGWLTVMGLALLGVLLVLAAVYFGRLRLNGSSHAATWGCGYPAAGPRMQYSASSFADGLVGLLRPLLRPYGHRPSLPPQELAPASSRFSSHVPEVVLELWLVPLLHRLEQYSSFLRQLQHGQLHLYLLYIFVTLFVLMVWALW